MKLKRFFFILLPLIFIGFIACNDRPIFAAIEQEINLKNFSVEGNILSLLEAGGNVYASNRGGVYSKSKNSDGSWSLALDAVGTQQLASNVDFVFACFTSGDVKYSNSTEWANVPNSGNIRIIAGDKVVFGYDAAEKKVYKIDHEGLSNPINTGETQSLAAAGKYVLVNSGGVVKLYAAGSSNAAEIAALPDGAKAVCSASTENGIFVLAGSKIHYYDGSSWSNKTISISQNPVSISYFKERQTVLVGCSKGYTEIKLDDAVPDDLSKAKQVNPGDSGSTTPSSSYSQYQTTLGSYYSSPVLGVSRGEGAYAVFMGIHSGMIKRNNGLWGFYSDKKREWNRE